mgnify:CR=1 FL=1
MSEAPSNFRFGFLLLAALAMFAALLALGVTFGIGAPF